MNSLIECIIDEITFNDLRVKQRSIGKLFPTFNQRVKAVASKGGVSLQEQMPTYWHFKVTSGTKDGVKYDTYVQFVNIEEMIKKYAGDRKLWNKSGDNIDLRLLAAEILNNVDMKTSCSCPATLYWGQDYIRTQRDAQHGKQEERPPKIRNPKQYGAYCKHGQNLFNVLPAYTATFASFLKKFWLDEIENAVELAAEEFKGFKKVASELGGQAGEMPTRYSRSGTSVPYSRKFPPEGEEPEEEDLPKEEPEEDEFVTPKHPGKATKTAGEITPKATSPGVKRLGIEQELGPKDKHKKGKYKPNESAVFEESVYDRLGQCYSRSGRWVLAHPEYELVHGTIIKQDGSGDLNKHAWTERLGKFGTWETAIVYDPILDVELPWDAFESKFGAKEEERYSSEEVVELLAKKHYWGRWDE